MKEFIEYHEYLRLLIPFFAVFFPLLGVYLLHHILPRIFIFLRRYFKKNSKELKLVNYIVQKHQNGEIDWQLNWQLNSTDCYKAKIENLDLLFFIWADNTCWLTFSGTEIKLKSEVYDELKIIKNNLQSVSSTPPTLNELDKVFNQLKIDKSIERDSKIQSVLNSSSIIEKIKNTFISK